MSLLVSADELLARRRIAVGSLAPLATGLRRELEPLVAHPPEVPTQKAHLSRVGGRCEHDGTLLAYDPFDARHRCPACGREHFGEAHDGFRLYWHQLWLAERVLHAALLGVLLEDEPARALAVTLLDAYAAQYLHYPNRDNVLGPSRPFFSTYLESIWLLQLVIALDLLETGAPHAEIGHGALGARVRDRLVAPSVALIASYDEDMSNRQVWNNAALIAGGILLHDDALVEHAVVGASGLHAHLDRALLRDGSWYEGENYHLFAHRGLWYGVQVAERHGYALPHELERRFREGFAAPFRTLLPDLTYPSRRDSQYAVSVRQPRFAESCELGLARGDDERLVGMLARLYDPAIPRGATGRAHSSADVERNLPATGLTRADLSWRSLLLAREDIPAWVDAHGRDKSRPYDESDLLPAQGIGVLRRDGGALYVALDYGHSGGGHGHPDRLNLLLADRDARWFDDPGTGSYVDPSLHWYRSTLAHTAPLVDGHSQPRVDGRLLAFEDRGDAGWISAEAMLADDLRVRRSVIVMNDYLIDLLEWEGEAAHDVALPWHGVDLVNERDEPVARTPQPISGGDAREDGFEFLRDTALLDAHDEVQRVLGRAAERVLRGWVLADRGTTWWSARAPDVPTRPGLAPLLLARHRAQRGRYLSVWSWRDAVESVEADDVGVRVVQHDGTCDLHSWDASGWRIERSVQCGSETRGEHVVLGGLRDIAEETPEPAAPVAGETSSAAPLPATFTLGEPHYRRSEESWSEAGRPSAGVTIATTRADTLTVTVDVSGVHRCFVPIDADNPLDNEPAAIDGAGVQLYVAAGERTGGWLLVPDPSSREVGVRAIEGWDAGLTVTARWEPAASGFSLVADVALPPKTAEFGLDVLVNETAPGRDRRRGQLVLSGARGEFVYLRGDRHEKARLRRFTISDA
ncbi:MAG TPA: heparinase II/III family protein [Candidatus Elarobacter sp.]|nr:heparinase II/III family protein [Candidatus Elarobacter sp.]